MRHSNTPVDRCPVAPKIEIPQFPGCRDRSCAFNYSENGGTRCVLWSLSGKDTVTERIDLLEKNGLSTPAILARHIEELTAAAEDYNALAQVPNPKTSCGGCGYVSPCSSTTLCEERRAALDALVYAAKDTITRYQIWDAVVRDRARFLPESFVTQLRLLLSTPRVKA